MLTIGKIGESEDQQKYYENSVAKSREDYYAGVGEAPGEFFGEGARALGLHGESDMEQLQRLFRGQDPLTGEQLRKVPKRVLDPEVAKDQDLAKIERILGVDVMADKKLRADVAYLRGKYHRDPELHAAKLEALFDGGVRPSEKQLRETLAVLRQKSPTVLGFDLTFSAPKSVSTLYALGDESLQRNVVAAHEWANEQAIGYMENESARVVRGHKDTDITKNTLTTHRANGFVGIKYRHRVNRLQDPHLHTHYVIGNWAQGPDGRYTALAAEHMYQLAKSGGAVYQLALRSKLRELEPWVEWGETKDALAELSPELMSPELLKAMSRRSQEIAIADAKVAAEKGMRVTRALHAQNWRETRNPKDMTAELGESWRDGIIDRASEWLTPEDVAAYREMLAFENTARFDVGAVQAHAFGPNGVTANSNTFEAKDVMIEVANFAPQGVGASLEEIYAARDAVMDSDEVLDVRTDKLRERKTTREYFEHEVLLVEAAVDGLAAGRAVVDSESIDQGLAEFYATNTDGIESLFPEQDGVLRGVVSDGNAISSVEARAGSGKTATSGAARVVFEAGGYRVFAAGPTGRAVRELAKVGFERPRTLSAWEVKFEILGPREAIRREFGDPSNAVLFVDETGMADTRLLSKIVTEMSAAGVKVVLVGDSYQLTSVRAGGMHATLASQVGAYELSHVTRQNHASEIRALDALRHGRPMEYIEFKGGAVRDETGEIVDWRARGDEDFEGRSDLEIFTGEDANEAGMRQAVADFMEMRDRGIDHLHERTVAGQPNALEHARGMHDIALITKDNTRRAALNNLIRDELTQRGVLSGHTIIGSYDGEDLEWAVGDRVIARRNHKGYDLDNGTLGTIVELDETGMTVLDDNLNERRFETGNAEDMKYINEHLEHAYALTAHGTQGATLRWAGVVGLPGEFSREWAYTALSRAKRLTKVYLVSAHTGGQEERKEYATEMDAELAHDKIRAQWARQMEQRDLQDAALLQRSRDGRLAVGDHEQLDEQASVEFHADLEQYREMRYRLAGEALSRTQGSPAIGGEKLQRYAELLVYRDTVAGELGSETMQDALQAAHEWRRYGEMIEDLHARAGESPLQDWQRDQVDVLMRERADTEAQHPNPQTLLSIESRHEQTLRTLDQEMRLAREAAIMEHTNAKPEWLTVLGTQPRARNLRDVWQETVDDLAGRYVDTRAVIEAQQIREATLAPVTEVIKDASPEIAANDTLAAKQAERDRTFSVVLSNPEDADAREAALAADHVWETGMLDSNPQWLTATLGERPADPKLAEQWEHIGRQLVRVRKNKEITSDIDNGYNHASLYLRKQIGRYRISAGLAPTQGTSQGFGIGD